MPNKDYTNRRLLSRSALLEAKKNAALNDVGTNNSHGKKSNQTGNSPTSNAARSNGTSGNTSNKPDKRPSQIGIEAKKIYNRYTSPWTGGTKARILANMVAPGITAIPAIARSITGTSKGRGLVGNNGLLGKQAQTNARAKVSSLVGKAKSASKSASSKIRKLFNSNSYDDITPKEATMQKFSSFITEWKRGEDRKSSYSGYNRRERRSWENDRKNNVKDHGHEFLSYNRKTGKANVIPPSAKNKHYQENQSGSVKQFVNKEAYQAHQMSTSRFKKFVDKHNPGVPDSDKKIFQATIKKGRVNRNADDAHYRTFKSNGKFAPKVGRAMGRLAAKSLSLSDKISNLAGKRKVSESAPASVRDKHSLNAKKAGKSIKVSRSKMDNAHDKYIGYLKKDSGKSIGNTNRKLRNLNNVQNKYDPGRRTMTKTTLNRTLRPYPKPAERSLMDTGAKKAERAKRKIGLRKESSTDIGSVSKVRKMLGTDGQTSKAIKTISNRQMRNARANSLLAKHGNDLPSDSRRSKRFKRLMLGKGLRGESTVAESRTGTRERGDPKDLFWNRRQRTASIKNRENPKALHYKKDSKDRFLKRIRWAEPINVRKKDK